MKAEIERLRKQVEQQAAASLGEAEVQQVVHVIKDRSKPLGLKPSLASFYAASMKEWKHHPHNENWARRNGYRRAQPGDFVETDGVSAGELHSLAEDVYGDLVLYVCPREHQEQRRLDAERRSAIAANAPLPEFRGPDGPATVTAEGQNNGPGRQS